MGDVFAYVCENEDCEAVYIGAVGAAKCPLCSTDVRAAARDDLDPTYDGLLGDPDAWDDFIR